MKKILSIDGGGIKGIFPASFLASVEESLEGKIGDYFDLVVGTSTGGIIALALGAGYSASEVLHFYETLGSSVFKGSRFRRMLRQLRIAKYDQEPLKKALNDQFGDKRLGDSEIRLVIPSLNLTTGEVHIYKTAHHPRLKTDYKVSMTEVALATSAAPTYFPTHKSAAGVPLIDGGMWANNPSAVAATEALSMLEWKKGEFKILSISCTGEPLALEAGTQKGHGRAYWGWRFLKTIMKAQSSASHGMTQHLAGHENIIRIDPTVPRGKYKLDGIDQIDSLKGLGASEARKALPDVRSFFENRADPFTPDHKLSSKKL